MYKIGDKVKYGKYKGVVVGIDEDGIYAVKLKKFDGHNCTLTNFVKGNNKSLNNNGYWCMGEWLELIKPKKDSIVKSVRKDLKQRSKVGIKKYNTTLDREDLTLLEWHQHHYEELLDAALYTKRIIKQLKK